MVVALRRYELLTLMTGYMNPQYLAAMSLVSQVYMQFWFAYLVRSARVWCCIALLCRLRW